MKALFTLFLLTICLLLHAQPPELWGTASLGGTNGIGTIMKINGDGSGFQRVFSFTNGSQQSTLLPGSGPLLYGNTVSGGVGSAVGSIFSYNSGTGDFDILFSFDTLSGYYPRTTPILATDGKLYGNSNNGGVHGDGTLWRFNLSNNQFEKLHDFDENTTGKYPVGDLFQASNGHLYGMASSGNSIGGGGTIYRYDIAADSVTVVHEFAFADGFTPLGGSFIEHNGKLYGMAFGGGATGYGTIFTLTLSDNSYNVVHDFTGGTQGSAPNNTLVKATDGLFYGMTSQGGADNDGVLFSFDPQDNFYDVLHDFDEATGNQPNGNLMQASDGVLYGMTQHGGANDFGVIFSYHINSDTYTKLHDCSITDGALPYGSLIEYTAVTAIGTVEENDLAAIFPNPTQGELHIRLNGSSQQVQLQVTNMLGELLEDRILAERATSITLPYPPGVYFVTLTNSSKRVTRKVVVE